MSRFLHPAGNVKTTPLAEILGGVIWQDLLKQVPRRRGVTACNPDVDGNDCAPAETICESNALVLPVHGRQSIGLTRISR